METFGDWLTTQLDEKGWSQAELARRAHISQPTLSRIISGLRQVGPDAAAAIARALGQPPEKVFRLAGLLPGRLFPPSGENQGKGAVANPQWAEDFLTWLAELPEWRQDIIMDAIDAMRRVNTSAAEDPGRKQNGDTGDSH